MNTNLFKIYHYLIPIINAASICNISRDIQAVRIVLDFTSYIAMHNNYVACFEDSDTRRINSCFTATVRVDVSYSNVTDLTQNMLKYFFF